MSAAISGLRYIRDSVASTFEAWGVPATVASVGLKYRSFALNQGPNGANRIVFIPGEYDGTPQLKARKYGRLSREGRNAGSNGNPREIASWERPFTVSIWAGPIPGQNTDEGQNGEQTEALLELLVRAFYEIPTIDGSTTIAASIRFGEVLVNAPPADNAFGSELLAGFVQIAPFFGPTYEWVQAQVNNVPRGTIT